MKFIYVAIIYALVMGALLFYIHYALKNKKIYFSSIVQLQRYLILLLYWVFYLPFFECFISVFDCDADGMHNIATSWKCYEGSHIVHVLLAILFLVLLFAVNFAIAVLYNETQPVKQDHLARYAEAQIYAQVGK